MRFFESLTDDELIERFQEADDSAFRALYKRHQPKIFQTVAYYIKDRTLAEDLSQEAFIKIVTSLRQGRYCEKGKFLQWALRLVHNHCLDYLRRKNNTAYVPDFTDTVLTHLAVPSAEMTLINQQTAAQLNALVAKLSPEQKIVLHYRHVEELSFKEIAHLTNTSVNTALGRMRYAIGHLRTMTQNHPSFR